jgi:hypothetical protein
MPFSSAVLDHETLRRAIDHDLHGFMLGVLEFPRRGLEELARLARHDLHILGAEAQRGAAAVHGGVADADDEHALADLVDVLERDGLEPGDADVNAVALVPPGNSSSLPFGAPVPTNTASNSLESSNCLHAVHRRIEPQVYAHIRRCSRSPRRAHWRAGEKPECWCASVRRRRRTVRRS